MRREINMIDIEERDVYIRKRRKERNVYFRERYYIQQCEKNSGKTGIKINSHLQGDIF